VIKFGQVYLSKPSMTEADGSTMPLFPHECRLRNLTYAAPLYIDITRRVLVGEDPETAVEEESETLSKVYLGRVPIMLRSTYCLLHSLSDPHVIEMNECPLDQGGYFVINGSEKVIIAQERMATNYVAVFSKAAPSPYAYVAEIRSSVEKGSKYCSALYLKMLTRSLDKGVSGQYIRATLPYIKQDIPVIVVFRALGLVADKDILEHIVYDSRDTEMLELLKPS
jgi:DNA-directed RNA polymerase II subunit RPB2